MSRKIARMGMMQILFVMNHNNDFSLDAMERVLATPREEDEVKVIHEIFKEQNKVIKRDLLEKNFNEGELKYIRESIPILVENLEEIDLKISNNLRNWSLDRLAQVDLAILRVAVFEFLFKEDIPKPVSINEAIEMAKTYSSDDSSRFINGILGSIIREEDLNETIES